ncbi:hypothetical protein [Pseudoxanthomonas wuyuanensis]
MLDPAVAMTPMATLLLALRLAAKEPGQSAIAVDTLIACHTEGRLDVPLLASTLRILAPTPLTKWSRYAKSIRRALQLDSGIAPVAFEMLCSMLDAAGGAPPKDAHLVLELLREVVLVGAHALPADRPMAQQYCLLSRFCQEPIGMESSCQSAAGATVRSMPLDWRFAA